MPQVGIAPRLLIEKGRCRRSSRPSYPIIASGDALRRFYSSMSRVMVASRPRSDRDGLIIEKDTRLFADTLFTTPLIDLGLHENPEFSGVMTPEPERGAERLGATAEFLENAEEYYDRFQQYEYWKHLLVTAMESAPPIDVRTIVEYGCGFGNATLPALEMFTSAKIVASDISPNLLAILQRLLKARGEESRCIPVAFDAHKPYLREGIADLVLGSAILHHLVEPERLITATSRVLRPGGLAVFFEPMEAGYAVLRLVIREICQEAAVREAGSPALTWLAELAADWLHQIRRDGSEAWRARDDKWLFSRSTLQTYAESAGLNLILNREEPQRSMLDSMADQLKLILRTWKGLDPEDITLMPAWTWDIVRRYDREFFSPAMKNDLPFAATVMFHKK